MSLQPLPVTFSNFRKLREGNYLYIDKTEQAYKLITGTEKQYFLARPRRFGKSLFVSTLNEILCGNKKLFNDLWIAQSNYSWQERGVIALDFSGFSAEDASSLKKGLSQILMEVANQYKLPIPLDIDRPDAILRNIVIALHAQYNAVAILIDEYDSPIVRSLENRRATKSIINTLRNFFSTIKSLGNYVDFVFITGVSSFAKAGVFSGMNNLQVISLDSPFATTCGYTDHEIDVNLSPYLQRWAQDKQTDYDTLRSDLKYWYNGYHFGIHVAAVYNPFSVMRALKEQSFENYWFESGTPSFLIEELKKEYRKTEYKMIDPEAFRISKTDLGIFEAGLVPLPALMFQTGYVTIVGHDQSKKPYRLGYPNYEVKEAFEEYLVSVLTQLDYSTTSNITAHLANAFEEKNIEEVVNIIRQLFSHVPYSLQTQKESFYHALLQMAFRAAGIKAKSETLTSHARIDMVLDLPQTIFVIECKFNQPAEMALKQIEKRRYYEQFLNEGKSIVLLGLSFERSKNHFDIKYAVKALPIKI